MPTNHADHPTLNIIEPTLHSTAGHCFGYVQSLLDATQADWQLRVWGDKAAASLFANRPGVFKGYFSRRWRKLQLWWLYRRLLANAEWIFVPTAGHFDLRVLDRLARRHTAQKIALHFHQYRQTPKKTRELQAIAQRHPQWLILAPTVKLTTFFQSVGFRGQHAPCPVPLQPIRPETGSPFRTVLYAGDMRLDKGFADVVALVQYCHQQQLTIPITLQLSPPRNPRAVEQCQPALQALRATPYAHLQTRESSLTIAEFQAQFQGAICLQLYDASAYHDKFSGVALEALYSGAPLLTVANTWMADLVEQFEVGIAVANTQPETVVAALNTIIARYEYYAKQARQAGIELRRLHDPVNTLNFIKALSESI